MLYMYAVAIVRWICHAQQTYKLLSVLNPKGWIERYQPDFTDKTTDGTDNHYWIMRNMGRGHNGHPFTGDVPALSSCSMPHKAREQDSRHDTGFAVIEPATKKTPGDVLLILSDGHTQFAILMGKALFTDDGEAIEGLALGEVEVMGCVTFFINPARDGDD